MTQLAMTALAQVDREMKALKNREKTIVKQRMVELTERLMKAVENGSVEDVGPAILSDALNLGADTQVHIDFDLETGHPETDFRIRE